MAKCIRCGGSLLTRGRVKLKDSVICLKCFKDLGFTLKDDGLTIDSYNYDQIKDGRDTMIRRSIEETALRYDLEEARKYNITLVQYRQLEAAGSTEMECSIFGAISALLLDEGREVEKVEISPGDNGSLNLTVDGSIFIRYKADDGVKWMVFENESGEKIRIAGPGRMNSYAPRIVQAFDSVNITAEA